MGLGAFDTKAQCSFAAQFSFNFFTGLQEKRIRRQLWRGICCKDLQEKTLAAKGSADASALTFQVQGGESNSSNYVLVSVKRAAANLFSSAGSQVYNKHGRIGIYTPSERAAIIARFHRKRSRRVWNKKIRYGCRKNLADRRMRVKGHFVKRSTESKTTPVATMEEACLTT
jgi:hypothetical protein